MRQTNSVRAPWENIQASPSRLIVTCVCASTDDTGITPSSPTLHPLQLMKIKLEKARKLISVLEETLQATTDQAAKAGVTLGKWRQQGEAGLRKKTSEALKLVRKKADGLTKALTHLEKSLAKSLDNLSDSIAKPAAADKAKKPAGKKARKAAK